jgi:hypothetical protein
VLTIDFNASEAVKISFSPAFLKKSAENWSIMFGMQLKFPYGN